MNIEQIQEVIKSFNIAFDGKLNSETIIAITDKIMPYFWMLQVKSLIVHILWAVAVVVSAWLIGKALIKADG